MGGGNSHQRAVRKAANSRAGVAVSEDKLLAVKSENKKHPLLAWSKGIGLAAILLGGFGVIPVFYWPGVALCYMGFVILALDPYFDPDLKQRRISQAAVLTFICALAAIFTFGFVFAPSKLEVGAESYASNYPAGAKVAGIKWSSKYTELRVAIANPSNRDYENLDLVLRPDQPVVEISQLDDSQKVSFEEVQHASVHYITNNEQSLAPRVVIASTDGYRVRCDRLRAHSRVNIVMAVASIAADSGGAFDNNGDVRPDATLEMSFEDGGKIWFNDAINDKYFEKRPTVNTLGVNGQYQANMRSRTISRNVPVIQTKDLMSSH